MSEDDVDRRSVLIGIGVAIVAGVGGFAGFAAAGPTPGDDDRTRDDRRDDDRDDDRGYDDDGDRSGSNRGRG